MGESDESAKSSKPDRKIAILIVQNDLPVAECVKLQTLLLCLGFEVEAVEGKCGALAATDRKSFALSFVDMRICDDDLFHIVVSVRRKDIPVLGLIFPGQTYQRSRKCQLSINDYIALPPNHSSLIELLRRWIV